MQRKKATLLILFLVIIILPLLILVIKYQTQTRSSAAAADKLEIEGGVLAGGATIQGDSAASGGNYVNFSINTITPTPIDKQIYYGAAISGWQNRNGEVDNFENKAGKKLSIIHFYTGWNSSYPNLATSEMNTIRQHGSIPMLTWEPGSSTTDSTYNLKSIINGNHDAYIRKFAKDSKTWGQPYFLRFAHEMNGNWYGWSESKNGNSSGDYIKAWKHVHDIFIQEGANNVTWVWCPNVESSTSIPLSNLYPGDDYVDWTCLDGYNWSTTDGSPWKSFTQIFKPSYDKITTSVAPSKPFMIGETSTVESGGSKANWITSTLTSEIPNNFPKLKAFVWFNFIQDGADWRIDTSTTSQNSFKTGIANPIYSSNNFSSLNSIPKN